MTSTAKHYSKTRIAPTPSGFLHLGNVLSFAVTAALARRHGAQILLRIDDLDRVRVAEQYIQDIFDTLEFLKTPWDEGPRNARDFTDKYSQLHRMDAYANALQQLRDKELVFACTCSRKQLLGDEPCTCIEQKLPLDTENVSWRLITDDKQQLAVKGYGGIISYFTLPPDMHSFIVRKKDGFPAYQLTSVIDDLFYGVDLIVRGHDLWASTLAQHCLATALGEDKFNDITFYHHPLLMGTGDKKLSKSAGSTSVRYLRLNGASAADVYKMIGQMLGQSQIIDNWQQLGEVILSR